MTYPRINSLSAAIKNSSITFVLKFTVYPLILREDKATMEQTETQVDVSGDTIGRLLRPTDSGPFCIPGTRVDVDIPFTGEEWIFRYKTNPWSTVFPDAEVRQGYLRISVSLPHDVNPEQFKENLKREIDSINKYVAWSYQQVMKYNRNLPQVVQQAITNRRQRLSKHAGIASLLDIPLATKSGVPSVTPVKIEIRRPPQLPVPPRTGLTPELGITDENYEQILHLIRHQRPYI